jgi:hypothetical protein
MRKKQARFWVEHKGSLVRLKLDAGQSVVMREGGPTDEGYRHETSAYDFDGEVVACEWSVSSRDCDGRHLRTGSAYCHVGRLVMGYRDASGITFPAWESSETGLRDFSAEAVNY